MPHHGLFVLNPKEVQLARETKRPPLLSAFERARTSVAEAKAIVAPDGDLLAFELDVQQVCRLTELLPRGAPPIKVLRDLAVPESKKDLPGIDGHCGIAGLHRDKKAGFPSKNYKKVRDELCLLAHPASD